ncbi:MAG: hypothetical protein LUI08_05260, partial [Prevotella sp.]|nr:hypothetical protein [Prevotella sp.]
MKKNFAFFFCMLGALSLPVLFTSCGDDDDDDGGGSSGSSKYSLVGTWSTTFADNTTVSFTFKDGGTGTSTLKKGSTSLTRNFKYSIMSTSNSKSYDSSAGSYQTTYVYSVAFDWTTIDSDYVSDSIYKGYDFLFESNWWDIQVYDYPSTNNMYMW